MKETELIKHFSKFLIDEKGYPRDSLILEYPIAREQDYSWRADLLIQNLEFREFLSVIEFKGICNKSAIETAYFQVKNYIDALGVPDLPAYLVCAKNEEFEIFIYDKVNKWIKVEKSQFPSYSALSAIRIATERNEKKTEKYKKEVKEQKERTITKVTTLISIISVMVAMLSYFISMQIQEKEKLSISKNQYKELNQIKDTLNYQLSLNQRLILEMSDRLSNYKMYIDSLSTDINNLDDNTKYGVAINKKLLKIQNDLKQTEEQINLISGKLDGIESIIIDDPNKILTIPLLRKEIESQYQELESKILVVNNDNDWIKEKLDSYGNTGITFFISILVALTSLIVGNILKTQKNK